MRISFAEFDFLRERLSAAFFLLALILGFSSASSSAFAFRTLEIGKKVPEFQLRDVRGNEFSLSSIQGKKIVIFFWGTDTPVKEKRSLAVMSRLEDLYQQLKGEGVELISVNSDPDSGEKIKALSQQHGWTHRVLVDERMEVYGGYGVYILPTVGILDQEKRLLKALPYTHTLERDVEGELFVALGKKTEQEWERERNPVETLLPEKKRKAQSHFNLGKNLLGRGSREKAKEEFLKAIELDPDHADSHIGLGMIYLKEKNPKEAIQFFEKGLNLSPSSRQGQIGMALAFEGTGENQKAIEKLEELLKMQKGTADLHYYLGRFYEKEGQKERALSEYKKALQFFIKVEK